MRKIEVEYVKKKKKTRLNIPAVGVNEYCRRCYRELETYCRVLPTSVGYRLNAGKAPPRVFDQQLQTADLFPSSSLVLGQV